MNQISWRLCKDLNNKTKTKTWFINLYLGIYLSSYSPIASPSRGKQAKGRERNRDYGRNGGIVYKCQFWQFERKYCVSASQMWDADLLIFCYGDKLARAMSLFMYCKEIMRSLPNGVSLRDFIFTCVLNQINHLFLRFTVHTILMS